MIVVTNRCFELHLNGYMTIVELTQNNNLKTLFLPYHYVVVVVATSVTWAHFSRSCDLRSSIVTVRKEDQNGEAKDTYEPSQRIE